MKSHPRCGAKLISRKRTVYNTTKWI